MLLYGFGRQDLDERCIDAFTHLPPPVSLHALDILGKRDFSHVRNMPGFIMSAVKQVGCRALCGVAAWRCTRIRGWVPGECLEAWVTYLPVLVGGWRGGCGCRAHSK
jgi:hypothetical protein